MEGPLFMIYMKYIHELHIYNIPAACVLPALTFLMLQSLQQMKLICEICGGLTWSLLPVTPPYPLRCFGSAECAQENA